MQWNSTYMRRLDVKISACVNTLFRVLWMLFSNNELVISTCTSGIKMWFMMAGKCLRKRSFSKLSECHFIWLLCNFPDVKAVIFPLSLSLTFCHSWCYSRSIYNVSLAASEGKWSCDLLSVNIKNKTPPIHKKWKMSSSFSFTQNWPCLSNETDATVMTFIHYVMCVCFLHFCMLLNNSGHET